MEWGNLITQYGYIIIFIVLLLGIIGLPIPDEVLLTYVGYNVFLGRLSLYYSLMFGMAGAICGISISYLLGFKFGPPLIKRFGPRFRITEQKVDNVRFKFSKYGGFFLIGSYFLPGIRHIAAYLAGMTTYRFRLFAVFAFLGAIVWVCCFIFLGIILGQNWFIIENVFRKTTFIFITMLIVFVIYMFNRKNTVTE
ncbi:DedA family protein [Bacillaceae bacterium W0354]